MSTAAAFSRSLVLRDHARSPLPSLLTLPVAGITRHYYSDARRVLHYTDFDFPSSEAAENVSREQRSKPIFGAMKVVGAGVV